jgi:hypothetical protein
MFLCISSEPEADLCSSMMCITKKIYNVMPFGISGLKWPQMRANSRLQIIFKGKKEIIKH